MDKKMEKVVEVSSYATKVSFGGRFKKVKTIVIDTVKNCFTPIITKQNNNECWISLFDKRSKARTGSVNLKVCGY